MTTNPPKEPSRPSRLEPPPVGRRDFLGLAALGAAATVCAVAAVGVLRLPKAAVLPSPSKRFKVTLPETLPLGQPWIPAGRKIALVRNADGSVHAISIVCTHLGCLVNPSPTGFDCPCHGSRFGHAGEVIRGPAPKSLPWLKVEAAGGGSYQVDEGEQVSPGGKA